MSAIRIAVSSRSAHCTDATCAAWPCSAKSFITALTAKDPNQRLSCQEALRHTWLTSRAGDENTDMPPVATNILRSQTAKPEGYYDGCELAKALTKHADDLPERVRSIEVTA